MASQAEDDAFLRDLAHRERLSLLTVGDLLTAVSGRAAEAKVEAQRILELQQMNQFEGSKAQELSRGALDARD